jgi:hypothetical protein
MWSVALRQPGDFGCDAGTLGEGFQEPILDVLRASDAVHKFRLGEAGYA